MQTFISQILNQIIDHKNFILAFIANVIKYSLSLPQTVVHRGDPFHLPRLCQLADLHQDEAELFVLGEKQVGLKSVTISMVYTRCKIWIMT